MSRFCMAEVATLSIGWVSNLLFLAYSQGFFHGVDAGHLVDPKLLQFAAMLAIPYALTFLFCWLSHRFVKAFLLLSLLLTIGSTCAYYGYFVAEQPLDGGWIFRAVPFAQTMIAVAFSVVIFLLSLIFKPKVKAAVAEQAAS